MPFTAFIALISLFTSLVVQVNKRTNKAVILAYEAPRAALALIVGQNLRPIEHNAIFCSYDTILPRSNPASASRRVLMAELRGSRWATPEVTASPTIPSDRSAQSTRSCRVIPSDEEIARALLKRASLQARTGAISAPIRRELEVNTSSSQYPLDPDLEMPLPALLQRAAAGQNTIPVLEQLKDAMARAILCARRKTIPPPDWVWTVVRDFKVTIDPELYRSTQTPEEDRTNAGGAPSSSKAEVAPSPGREITSAEVGEGLGASEHAVIHGASVADTLERIRKQETIDTLMDFDPFAGLDTWLASRELANSRASEPKWEGDSMEGVDFEIFSLALDDPAVTREYSGINNISGPSDLGESKSNEHMDRLELDGANGSDAASTSCDNAAAIGSCEPQPIQTLQDFEHLFP